MPFNRTAGASGIVFIVLLVLNGVFLGSQPLAGDDISEIRDYVTTDNGMHKSAVFIGMLVLPFAVIFFAGLIAKLRTVDVVHGESWAVAALLGAVFIGASAGTGDVLYATSVFRSGDGLDDAVLRALWDGQIIAYSSTGIALTALTAAVAVPVLRHRAWPSWYGVLSGVVAVLGVLSLISTVSDSNGGSAFGFIGFAAMGVWILVTSVLLLREPAAAPGARSSND